MRSYSVRNFWLNFHVGYACRHSGACCTSGWPIPVEHDRVIPIQSLAARADTSWLIADAHAPADVAGTLAVRANGECTFFRIPTPLRADASAGQAGSAVPTSGALPSSAGCTVHPARPSSCSHFPFVCLIDARGVHVTLSHYCPTAASLLFDDTGPLGIVEGPPPVPGFAVPEGLDARDSLPPTFAEASAGRPNATKLRLMSWDEFTAWERAAIAEVPAPVSPAVSIDRFECVRRSVPQPWSWPEAPPDFPQLWHTLAAARWPEFAAVVGRYRAAKIFASWAAYQGDGHVAVIRLADLADAALRVETVRQCLQAGRALDAELLKQAVRRTDLLLVHYADGRVLSSGTAP